MLTDLILDADTSSAAASSSSPLIEVNNDEPLVDVM